MKTLIAFIVLLFATIGYASTNVTLAWDASTDTNVAGYKVYYGTVSGIYTSTVTVPGRTNTSVVRTNMVPWRYYYFAASDYASNGIESLPSPEIVWTNRGNAPFGLQTTPAP